jgi:hypothetical protein
MSIDTNTNTHSYLMYANTSNYNKHGTDLLGAWANHHALLTRNVIPVPTYSKRTGTHHKHAMPCQDLPGLSVLVSECIMRVHDAMAAALEEMDEATQRELVDQFVCVPLRAASSVLACVCVLCVCACVLCVHAVFYVSVRVRARKYASELVSECLDKHWANTRTRHAHARTHIL